VELSWRYEQVKENACRKDFLFLTTPLYGSEFAERTWRP
jgi:hypothetical protein